MTVDLSLSSHGARELPRVTMTNVERWLAPRRAHYAVIKLHRWKLANLYHRYFTSLRELIEVHYPQAEKLVLVMDHLNTHSPASFYEVFEPAPEHHFLALYHGRCSHQTQASLSVN